ncbi:MAG: hypothetical protein VYB23_03220, partial [Candidatus Thermoplasmatota archaeon]|nr:hypothetical protein [Candidatus Thermoplasmatota archaeon]
PNCGTSRDYGYGHMGFPTFTFETDDEQFVPGSFENLNERLAEEMDVMRFLIDNVWYWRARLDVQSITIDDDTLTLDVANHGMASTANASLEYHSLGGEVLWSSPFFGVNATNSTQATFSMDDDVLETEGMWNLNYQKRVINAAIWVNETVDSNVTVLMLEDEEGFLTGFGLFNPVSVLLGMLGVSTLMRNHPSLREEERA